MGISSGFLFLDNAVNNLESENQEIELKIDSLKELEVNVRKQKEIKSLELENTKIVIR